MTESFGRIWPSEKSDGVMAWIAVEEGELDFFPAGSGQLDIITNPHAQYIPVEIYALIEVIHSDDHMAQPLLCTHKSGRIVQ